MPPETSDALPAPVARARPAGTTRPGGRRPRSSLVLAGLVLAAVLSTRWVRVNVSPSSPYGLYRLAAVTPPLTRGTLVLMGIGGVAGADLDTVLEGYGIVPTRALTDLVTQTHAPAPPEAPAYASGWLVCEALWKP